MKRWFKKADALGVRMELREHSDGWSCYVVPSDTPTEPIIWPRTGFAVAPGRDDASRGALTDYAAGGRYRQPGEPVFPTFAEHYAHSMGTKRPHPW